MTDFKQFIKGKRASLSDSSIITYASILKNLYGRVFGNIDKVDFTKFETDAKTILKSLDDLPPNKRKTILSALVVVTGSGVYRELMMEDVKDYNKEIAKQQKSEAQEANWVEPKDIKEKLESLKAVAEKLLKAGSVTDMADLDKIQNYIIICLLGGTFIVPRRNKDYCDFKIKGDIDKTKDNYLEGNTLFFNSYKTAKAYGKQEIVIDNTLKKILEKWIKVNPTEWLLFDTKGGKLTSVKLNQRLNKIFDGMKVGVNILRHSYLTDKYADVSLKNKKLAEDMAKAGSSVAMADTYIKTD